MDFELPAGIRENVPGMLTEAEGAVLAELAAGKVVLELGSYTGLSTIVMARVAEHVVTVDWHRGDESMGFRPWSTLRTLEENVEKHGVRDKVTVIAGLFQRVVPLLRDRQFDLVYIDGTHHHGSIVLDTGLAWTRLRDGGKIAWHDADRVEVQRAILAATSRMPASHEIRLHGKLTDRLLWGELHSVPMFE